MIYHPKALGGYQHCREAHHPWHSGGAASPTRPRAFSSPILPVGDPRPVESRQSQTGGVAGGSVDEGHAQSLASEALGLAPARNELELHGRPVLRLLPVLPSRHSNAGGLGRIQPRHRVLVPGPCAGMDARAGTAAFSGWRPAAGLRGFGSMPSEDAAAKTSVILAALAETGLRGVLATGWVGWHHAGA